MHTSNETIVIRPGRYTLTDLPDGSRDLPCSGSNNTIDLSDVHVTVPVGTTRRSYIIISGNNNIFRGGIRLYLASRATVTNSTAIDCGHTNFNMPSGGKITGSTGNFAYAPLSDFRLSKSRQDIELTILPSPHNVGPHNLADILGSNHNIVFHRTKGPLDTNLRPIVIQGDGSTIRNETEYPIVLQVSASGNTVASFGPVTDLGSKNKISRIERPRE